MKPERIARDDAGFTIIELVIVVVIEAMIVTALGSAFVLVMNSSTTTKESLLRTNDARFVASYIVSDARNSSGPETSLSDTASCPDTSPPVSGSQTVGSSTSFSLHVSQPREYYLIWITKLAPDVERFQTHVNEVAAG